MVSLAAIGLYAVLAWLNERDRLLAFAPLLLVGCSVIGWVEDGSKQVGGEVGGHLAEWIACPTNIAECGHVFQCESAANTPSGFVELCVDDDDHPEDLEEINSLYGPCEPTPRHEGLCFWHCDGGRGCNAYLGCWGCE